MCRAPGAHETESNRHAHDQLQQLAMILAQLLERESGRGTEPEVTRLGALVALLRLEPKKYLGQADESLRECLIKGAFKLARVLLIGGAIGFMQWPSDRNTRILLFHPSPEVRAATAFLVGHQKRSFEEELHMLQRDSTVVAPFISDAAMRDIGRTVGECARLALARISGQSPNASVAAW